MHLIWEIRFDSEESAAGFLKAALSAASALAGTERDPLAGEISVTPEERFVSVIQSKPDTVRFINASSEDHAATLSR